MYTWMDRLPNPATIPPPSRSGVTAITIIPIKAAPRVECQPKQAAQRIADPLQGAVRIAARQEGPDPVDGLNVRADE